MNHALLSSPLPRATAAARRHQRGGFTIGLVVGLLVGLGIALGVALYVTKAPIPFVNKVPTRPAGQDAADAERNRAWDPNGGLAGRNPMPGAAPASAAVTTAAAPMLVPPRVIDPVLPGASNPALLGPRPAASGGATTAALTPGAPATRASSPVATAATGGNDPFSYFVQAGAFARSEDAEQQRARLAMLGVESRLTEREQGGRTVFRVRAGPFDRKEDADAAKEKLSDGGVDSALVRVQR